MSHCEKVYIKEVQSKPTIPSDRHLELLKSWQENGDIKSFNLLYSSIIKFVPKIAQTLRSKNSIHYMDLLQEGNIAVYNALKKYDTNKYTNSVCSYSLRLVRNSMIKFLKANEKPVSIKGCKYINLSIKNREATTSQIMKLIKEENLKEEKFLHIFQQVVSKANNRSSYEIEEKMDSEKQIQRKELIEMFFNKVNLMEDKKKSDMLISRFLYNQTFTEIAKKYDMSKQNVEQIVKRELKIIRSELV